MTCPNCGLANQEGARFCANCGTTLGNGSSPNQPGGFQNQSQYQAPPNYQAPAGRTTGNSMAKNIGLGCLIALVLFMFVGLSCTRACFGRHRTYVHRRY